MTIHVFTGPTLSAEEGRRELDAVFHAPATQGDVYRVAQEKPLAIAIIDGYFERVPSVSHKEILWAMSQGIHVFGAASMGALRAAELSAFGMEGIGVIYEAYRKGEIDADDEVAVAHAAAEDGYRPASEAMVNIRATLRAAERAGAVGEQTRATLERVAKGLFYADRCYPILLSRAAREGVSPAELDALQAFLPHGRVHQKRLDALAMLRALRERFAGEPPPKRVPWHFEHTDAWEHIRESARQQGSTADHGRADPAIEEMKLAGGYPAARRAAMARSLAIELARRLGRSSRGPALKQAVEGFRCERGLFRPDHFKRWLKEQEIADVGRFFQDEAQLRWAEILFGADAERRLADHLRSTGEYAALAARGRDKRGRLPMDEAAEAPPRDELLRWYFGDRLRRPVPADVGAHAREAGFANDASFLAAVAREHRYLRSTG